MFVANFKNAKFTKLLIGFLSAVAVQKCFKKNSPKLRDEKKLLITAYKSGIYIFMVIFLK